MSDDLEEVTYRTPGEPRDWETLCVTAIAAARDVLGDDELAERVTGAVLAVFDEEALNRLGAHLVSECRIRSMDFRNGVNLDLAGAREVAATWVAAARTLLAAAPDYSQAVMEFGIAEDPQRYAFTVQKIGALTPHEARRQAEAALDEARAEVERLRAALKAKQETAERSVRRAMARRVLALDAADHKRPHNRGPFWDMQTALRKAARGEALPDPAELPWMREDVNGA